MILKGCFDVQLDTDFILIIKTCYKKNNNNRLKIKKKKPFYSLKLMSNKQKCNKK